LFGADDPLGKMIHIDDESYEVIGLIEQREALFGGPSENQIVIIPFGTFDKYYPEREKEFLQFICLVSSPEEVERGMNEAREALRRHRHPAAHPPDNFLIFPSPLIFTILTPTP